MKYFDTLYLCSTQVMREPPAPYTCFSYESFLYRITLFFQLIRGRNLFSALAARARQVCSTCDTQTKCAHTEMCS